MAVAEDFANPTDPRACGLNKEIRGLTCSSKLYCACFVRHSNPESKAVQVLPDNVHLQHVSFLRIKTSWNGLGPARTREYTILNDNGRFLIDNKPVDESRISALLEAVREPREQKPSLVDLGIDAQWLSTNAEEALKDAFRGRYDSNGRPVSLLDSDQKARFLALFTDPEVMNEIFRAGLIEGWNTDDYPEVEVELGLQDKSTIGVHSNSASLFLLPWRIQGQEPKKFFDHRLSLALASLLPHDAPNASRLAGNGLNGGFLSLRSELANGLAHWIQLGCFKGDFNLACD